MPIRFPDQRLVYLHCSSIFKEANAQIRRPKKINQLLSAKKSTIKILTKEFTLDAIAAVAKQLLDDRVFESLPRARLRFPELFEPSVSQEAEREASEEEVARIEAEAAHETIVTSDEEWDEQTPENKTGQAGWLPTTFPTETVGEDAQSVTAESKKVLHSTQEQDTKLIPRLHPVYLPFKTQHQIMSLVQSILEECCFEFGNSWVPELMKAQKWEDAKSIELTQWTRRFSKHASRLPLAATKTVAGKDLVQVLFATNSLRHSAVHRLQTSAAGVLKMINAAIAFTEALQDTKRATDIETVKRQLVDVIEDIVQHQTMLENKLSDQLSDCARRRAEIDELERLAVDDMLSNDKIHRDTAGLAVENSLASFELASRTHIAEPNGIEVNQKDGSDSEEGDVDDQKHGLRVEDFKLDPPDSVDPCAKEGSKGQPRSTDDERNEASFFPSPRGQNVLQLREPTMMHDSSVPSPTAKAPSSGPAPSEAFEEENEALPGIRDRPIRQTRFETSPNELQIVEKHTIAMKILDGTNLLTSIACLDSCTKAAISNEARRIYSERVLHYEGDGLGCVTTAYHSSLQSVCMDSFDMDLSTYNSEDLTTVVRMISKTSIPTFTVKIDRTPAAVG